LLTGKRLQQSVDLIHYIYYGAIKWYIFDQL